MSAARDDAHGASTQHLLSPDEDKYDDLDPSWYGLDEPGLTESERLLKLRERRENAALDRVAVAYPDRLPRGVFFIIPNEFCERYAFYGLKSLLKLYFQRFLRFDGAASNNISTIFTMLCYFTPLGGAAVSDSFLGKYRTVVVLSLVYLVGTALLSVTAIPGLLGTAESPAAWGVLVSLLLIAIGTGGIKPNIASLGADQYLPFQATSRAAFFSWFYLAINAGTLFSKMITPLLKSQVHCFGRQDCYPLAFAVPAVLMGVAIGVFLAGSRWYRRIPPTGTFVPGLFLQATWRGAVNTLRGRECRLPGQHWIVNANFGAAPGEQFSDEFLEASRRQIGICKTLSPVIVFWTLFDQQDTTWTDQILRLNQVVSVGSFSWQLLPEQISVLNPIFVVAAIPICQNIIYPAVERRIGRPVSSLAKIFVGMLLTAVAFSMAGVLQLWADTRSGSLEFDDEYSTIVCRGDGTDPGCVSVLFQIPQYLVITFAEVLVSVSGLEYAYAVSHPIMKATSSSLWLLTVAFGQVIFLLVQNVPLFDLAGNLFLFSALMFIVAVVFRVISRGQ